MLSIKIVTDRKCPFILSAAAPPSWTRPGGFKPFLLFIITSLSSLTVSGPLGLFFSLQLLGVCFHKTASLWHLHPSVFFLLVAPVFSPRGITPFILSSHWQETSPQMPAQRSLPHRYVKRTQQTYLPCHCKCGHRNVSHLSWRKQTRCAVSLLRLGLVLLFRGRLSLMNSESEPKQIQLGPD